MTKGKPAAFRLILEQSDGFREWRQKKDLLVRRFVGLGGTVVLLTIGLIFVYLLWVVSPLLMPAETELKYSFERSDWAGQQVLYLAMEEQREVGFRLPASGQAEFFLVSDGTSLQKQTLFPDAGLAAVTESIEQNGVVAAVTDSGAVHLFRHSYETQFHGGVDSRKIVPTIDNPYGEAPVLQVPPIANPPITLSDNENGVVLAVAGPDDRIHIVTGERSVNFLTGESSVELNNFSIPVDFDTTALTVSGNHRWLYLGDNDGRVHRLEISEREQDQVINIGSYPIRRMTMLLGGSSILAGDQAGVISQLFPVRDLGNEFSLRLVRQFTGVDSPILGIYPEQRRKGFAVLSEDRELTLFHSTSGSLVHRESLEALEPMQVALSPRANGLFVEGEGGRSALLEIRNDHPEISFSTLWQKVWYENYDEPEYVWQSSAANNDFEPKFSLTPLAFGTFKAAVYAMLFAAPLALAGAIYTALFMSPTLRRWVKPTIELMAALPTVILGFLAGLWFAPFLEENLAGIFMVALFLPVGFLAFAMLWRSLEESRGRKLFAGWEALIQIPVIVILVLLALWLAQPVQDWLFAGDLRAWLTQRAGISYDQRNALVVGCAMGFAVIPTIFSIAEDSLYGVPRSLRDGSLALGATQWQSMVRVILPTASPGIFSALMIGMGRAVGETMIVLMATGNTPIMEWSLFEGMRTLAANIAVELPESEVASSHYRILFLAALVLFVFTFIVNTGAEIVRQRIRTRYRLL